MKTERRHELAKNDLADWLGERIEALRPYSGAVSASVLAAAVLIFAGVVWYQKREATASQAWEEYFSALEQPDPNKSFERLEQVADDYPADSPAALWSRLSLADSQLSKGVDELFKDRTSARKALDDAIDHYRAVVETAPAGSLLAERATFGLAEAYESKNDLEQAREHYREVLAEWPDGAFSSMAKSRLDDLDRKSTKDFYDWFAKQSPINKPLKGPGTPGEKPAFDLGSLPEHPFESNVKLGDKKPESKPKDDAGKVDFLGDSKKTRPDAEDEKADRDGDKPDAGNEQPDAGESKADDGR